MHVRPLLATITLVVALAVPVAIATPASVAATSPVAHPSLLFSAADLPALRARIASGVPAQAWAILKRKVDAYTDATSPAYVVTSGPFLESGQNQSNTYLTNLGFAYALSGDVKYGRTAIDILLAKAAANWPAWNTNELGRGDLTRGVGLAFDWTYALMTPAERSTIVTSLTANETTLFSCLYSSFQFDQGGGPGFNWDSVCGGGNGLTLLAIEGEPGAPADLDARLAYARTRIVQTLPAQFGAHGDWAEGNNYAMYGLHNALPFAQAWQRLRGEDLLASAPGLEQFARQLAYEQLPGQGALYLPRNDSPKPLPFTAEILADLYGIHPDGTLAWLWDHTVGPHGDDLFGAGALPVELATPVGEYPCGPPTDTVLSPLGCWTTPEVFTILHFDPSVPAVDPSQTGPLSQHYASSGLVDLRTGWSRGVNEVVGSYEAKHDHPAGHYQEDLGHFSLYGYGSEFAVDSGYGHNYSCSSYTAVVEGGCPTVDGGNAYGHNVVLVDGNNHTQDPYGALHHAPTIAGYLDGDSATLVRSDLRTAYAENYASVPEAGRDVLFTRLAGAPTLLAVTDHLDRDGASHTYSWQMHTDSRNVVTTSGNTFSDTALSGATMTGALVAAGTPSTVTALPSDSPRYELEMPIEHVTVKSEATGSRFDHLAVMAVTAPGAVPAVVSPVPASRGAAATASWAGGEALFATRAGHSGVVSTSRLTATAEDVEVMPTRPLLLVGQGSSVVVDGTPYLTVTGGAADVELSGRKVVATGPVGASYRVRAPLGVSAVQLNDQPTTWVQDGADVVFPAPILTATTVHLATGALPPVGRRRVGQFRRRAAASWGVGAGDAAADPRPGPTLVVTGGMHASARRPYPTLRRVVAEGHVGQISTMQATPRCPTRCAVFSRSRTVCRPAPTSTSRSAGR